MKMRFNQCRRSLINETIKIDYFQLLYSLRQDFSLLYSFVNLFTDYLHLASKPNVHSSLALFKSKVPPRHFVMDHPFWRPFRQGSGSSPGLPHSPYSDRKTLGFPCCICTRPCVSLWQFCEYLKFASLAVQSSYPLLSIRHSQAELPQNSVHMMMNLEMMKMMPASRWRTSWPTLQLFSCFSSKRMTISILASFAAST